MIQTIITYLIDNYIALIALFVSLISFCLNYINLKDKRRSEVYQLISDSFTKASITRNQLKSILANYEITLATLKTFGESEYKYSFIKKIQTNKQSIENSLNNLEHISKELIKVQKGNFSGNKLALLHTVKLNLLTIDNQTNEADDSAIELLRLIETLQKHEEVISTVKLEVNKS